MCCSTVVVCLSDMRHVLFGARLITQHDFRIYKGGTIKGEEIWGGKMEKKEKRNRSNDKMEIEIRKWNAHKNMIFKGTDLHRGHSLTTVLRELKKGISDF